VDERRLAREARWASASTPSIAPPRAVVARSGVWGRVGRGKGFSGEWGGEREEEQLPEERRRERTSRTARRACRAAAR
jgi:hypothetical protein